MPIDFTCRQCGRLLRTPDDTAGREAKCPSCGEVQTVPASSSAVGAAEASPSGEPVPPAAGGSYQAPPPGPSETPMRPGPAPSTGASPNPYQSPSTTAPGYTAYAASAAPLRPTRIDIGYVLGQSWEIFKRQWAMCVVAVLIMWALSFAVSALMSGLTTGLRFGGVNELLVVLIELALNIVANLFSLWLGLGVTIFFLRITRGESPSLGDLFAGSPFFLRAVGATILLMLMIYLPVIVCLVPGLALLGILGGDNPAGWALVGLGGLVGMILAVIIGLTFGVYQLLIVDRRAGVIESLSLSRQVTAGNRLSMFALGVVYVVISLLGAIPCCIGLIFTTPFALVGWTVTYLSMTGQFSEPTWSAQSTAMPSAPPA